MTSVQYTVEVKERLLLELPPEAEELHLKPGEKVHIQLYRNAEETPQIASRKNGVAARPSINRKTERTPWPRNVGRCSEFRRLHAPKT